MNKHSIKIFFFLFFLVGCPILHAALPTGSSFVTIPIGSSSSAPNAWESITATSSFTITFRANIPTGKVMLFFMNTDGATSYRITLSNHTSAIIAYPIVSGAFQPSEHLSYSTEVVHDEIWHRITFSPESVVLARSDDGVSGWADYANITLSGFNECTGYGFTSLRSANTWQMSNFSFSLSALSLADFNTNASTYETGIDSMLLSALNAVTTTSLETELDYDNLSSEDQTTANATIANLLSLVIARRDSLNMTAFNDAVTTYQDGIDSMSLSALNAVTLANLRTTLLYDNLTTSQKATADSSVTTTLNLVDARKEVLNMAAFNGNVTIYQAGISSMALETANAVTHTSLQTALGYSALTTSQKVTADSSINATFNLVAARIFVLTATTWSADGRTYAHVDEAPYDTTAEVASLKVTTGDIQLFHDLTKNPNFTQLGAWQFKDSTNGHTWEFDPVTGEWTNITSGYTWKYSKNVAGQWIQETVSNKWTFDEGTRAWSHTYSEASE